MENAVISDKLKELLADRPVRAAVFTTYTFEPEFLELEVLPLLIGGNTPFSTDDRVKRFQVRESLREADFPVDAFYDLPLFRQEGNSSPGMEYGCHGVHEGNRAFHAKLILLLVHDESKERDCLIVAAGSNNLTKAGWWDNIECQHWETVWSDAVHSGFLNQLRDDLVYLGERQQLTNPHRASAVDRINRFLRDCSESDNAEPVYYFGLARSSQDFPGFLRQNRDFISSHENWNLEIISPFFAEDTANLEHMRFLDLGVERIFLFLPQDEEKTALCPLEYFEHIRAEPRVEWAEWTAVNKQSLGLSGPGFRRLHAKVYRFYNHKQSWIFVGSINFTHKAMYDNVEAGFLVPLDDATPWLEPIEDVNSIDRFIQPEEPPPGASVEHEESSTLPEMHLAFDWVDKRLTGKTMAADDLAIFIHGPEGEPVTARWNISATRSTYPDRTESLEETLKNGSLVKVSGFDRGSGIWFPEHRVLLQQTGWTHKPIDHAALTPAEILTIYADMSRERRQALLTSAVIHKLVLAGYAGEITSIDYGKGLDQFFCEYAEIFHAFRQFRTQLKKAFQEGQDARIDYYLSGAGMDSLPTLRKYTVEHDDTNALSSVTEYLLLLCMQEVYQDPQLSGRAHVMEQLRAVESDITEIKASKSIRLENDNASRRERFFDWFETQFFKEYRALELRE